MQQTNRPQINSERLWASLMEMAQIGATEKGGVNRVAFTDEDRRGRDLFKSWCEAAGCTVSVDRFGNMFARRPGRTPDAPVIMTGSHLDSQPTGGRFDGVYGVLAGLEVVRTLNDAGIETDAPLEVAVWTNEEGVIFKPMLGSSVWTGAYDLEETLAMREDQGGWSVREGLERIGYAGDAPIRGYPVACYLESHIEQGPVMELNDTVIGVVTATQGQRWYDLETIGQEAHAGPTPMEVRKDAMMAAAEMMLAFDRIGRETENGRATCGRVHVYPNSPNTIPGRVAFSGDLRHPDEDVLLQMDQRMRAEVARIAERRGVDLTIGERMHILAMPFDPGLVSTIREAAKRSGKPWQDIYTGAGHDACNIAKILPTAMIFVPCEGGISHNEVENARPEDLAAGCQVLCETMVAAANGEVALGQPG